MQHGYRHSLELWSPLANGADSSWKTLSIMETGCLFIHTFLVIYRHFEKEFTMSLSILKNIFRGFTILLIRVHCEFLELIGECTVVWFMRFQRVCSLHFIPSQLNFTTFGAIFKKCKSQYMPHILHIWTILQHRVFFVL